MATKLILVSAFASLAAMACQPTIDASSAQAQTSAKMDKKTMKTSRAEDIGNRGDVMMAVQNQTRSDKDKADDGARKPDQVLMFTQIWPGMTVLEMEAGGGYYTELMSHIVGKSGKVIMQNPPAFDAFFKPEVLQARLGANGERLSNVIYSRTNFDALDAPDNSVDIVTWFLGPHELFYTPKGSKGLGEVEKAYAEIYRVLKPGGKFIALDHAAKVDSPETTGGETHRIDPQSVIKRAETAGLNYVKSSKVLRNDTDDHSKNVFDPAVRRKTDRFLQMYTKPE